MEQKEPWNYSLARNMSGRACAKCGAPVGGDDVIGLGVRRLQSPEKTECLPLVFVMATCPSCGQTNFFDLTMRHSEFMASAFVAWSRFKDLKGTPDPVPTGR